MRFSWGKQIPQGEAEVRRDAGGSKLKSVANNGTFDKTGECMEAR